MRLEPQVPRLHSGQGLSDKQSDGIESAAGIAEADPVAKKKPRAKVLSSKVLFRGRVFGVRRDRVIEPGGIRAVRELVIHPGSVVVLPVFPDGRILVIRQFRYVTGRYLWELVAGHKEPGENFAAGARRELQEEAGYRARRLKKLRIYRDAAGLARHTGQKPTPMAV